MGLHKSKSRVQFQGRTKKGGKQEKNRIEVAKQKHTDDAARSLDKFSKVFEDGSETVFYEDIDEDVAEEMPLFSKKRVSSTQETELSGVLKSNLRAGITASSSSAIDEDSSDSPSDSLLIQAPLYVQVDEQLQSVPPAQTPNQPLVQPPAPVMRERSPSSTSLLHKIVTLFAGRKKKSKRGEVLPTFSNTENIKKHSKSDPTSGLAGQHIDYKVNEDDLQAESIQTATPLPLPKLTLPQVIPPIRVAGAEHLSLRPGYKEILPAPEHKYTGNATVAKDIFEPTEIQRGFEVVKTPPRAHRRNNSRNVYAGNLLDRDGNTWANYHTKNPSPDQMPFSRTQSVAEQLDQQAMVVGKQIGGSCARMMLQTGHGFLANTGDAYPYAQGLCW